MTSNPFPILIERFFTDHLRTQRWLSCLGTRRICDHFAVLEIFCTRGRKKGQALQFS